jgi:hypothetical protein
LVVQVTDRHIHSVPLVTHDSSLGNSRPLAALLSRRRGGI